MTYSKSFKIKILAILLVIISIPCLALANNEVENSAVYTTENYVDTQNVSSEASSDENSINLSVDNKDLFLYKDSVTIDNVVSGNVFIVAKDVTINNIIDGNVFILANKVTITDNSYIYSDLFVSANNITIGGYVYDMYVNANTVLIDYSACIIRNATVNCNEFNLKGYIKRDAAISCKTLNIDENAKIAGDLNYKSDAEAQIPENAIIGKVNFNKSEVDSVAKSSSVAKYVRSLVKTLIIALVVVLISVLASKKFAGKLSDTLVTKFWPVTGYGALGLIVVPLGSLILFCTIIGIIPGISLFAAYAFLLSISSIFVSIALGNMICKNINKPTNGMVILMSMLIVLGIWILSKLPFLGFIVSIFVNIVGSGLILYLILKSFKSNKNKKAESKDDKKVVEAKVEESKVSDESKDSKDNKKEEKVEDSKSNDSKDDSSKKDENK